ncbi:MAG: penicillin-binding transpeptidase domain-containing protein, partial [Lachnospiraceae bacterium]
MFDKLKEIFANIFKSRLLVLSIVMFILAFILIQRMVNLQIINGQEYLDNYTLKIEKTRDLAGTRGNIYDRNGKLLAYNELAYAVMLEDNGTYTNKAEKNKALNHELYRLLKVLDKNKDSIKNDFYISYSKEDGYEFTVTGTTLKRFLADIYDHTSTDDLKYNRDLGYNEAEATPQQVIDYLSSEKRYDISSKYSEYNKYRILVLRYAIAQNSYQKFILTPLATGVSDETVAWVSENANNLQGMTISEETVRKYNDSEYFAHIIGYTGKISVEEYEELSEKDDSYSLTDVVGKSGIEQVMDKTLQGTKGYEKVSVDNLGKVVETLEHKEPSAGDDVYLSIDADLTKAVYDLLEQEIAGIVYSKIINAKEYNSTGSAADIMIPVDDVYFSFINNSVIDTSHFTEDDASDTEKAVYAAYTSKESSVLSQIDALLSGGVDTPFGSLDEEYQDYITEVINRLKSDGILNQDAIDTSDEQYVAWKEGSISLNAYLNHAITKGWIDITKFSVKEKYSDSDEIFASLSAYILKDLKEDSAFRKLIYKYMIRQNLISGTQLCLILYDQGILEKDEAQIAALSSGSVSAYNFVKEKIKSLEITPAMLALDPCSGSCVITDVNTGEILACVSYPGYDNNRLANSVDSDYYASLSSNLSLPLYNHATQQRTAPGSTFKMITSTAGLTEGVITTGTQIVDKGQFERFANGPKCWIYPHGTHGSINVSGAIRDSCNYFFYEVGYQLSMDGQTYNEEKGLETIKKYASLFGLDSNTGIEIPESSPQIADEYPVTAAIGQSNNNYTTTQIARYVTAVANSGTVYNQTLLKKVCTPEGKTIEEYAPTVKSQLDMVASSTWDAIHSGMRMVVENTSSFDNMGVEV